ncbi:transporter substrate-binding domain-containing protein [Microbulbifer sp. CAU 1566]|uniref:transporter substrate-binding domain-containing protein n=1 Tax=Microbulbifer sp. CAU 1566 TaxID=2933269 RepID=UPI0020035C67|nr:transporter substrate-binding domain-containing protein [Microbulbifer sp. CAU 1566]MCK7595728.1 transporter substrate-binding domain-containing protein [Microbulbifer sp. CAU 1566]
MGAILSKHLLLPVLVLTLCGLIVGCDNKAPSPAPGNEPPQEFKKERDTRFENYDESGDLSALKKRGSIRFVTLATSEEDLLPRAAIVTQLHYQLAEDLAKRLKLEPHWIAAASPEKALEMIKNGRADVFTGNLTRTEERAQNFDLTEAIANSRQQLVTGQNGPDVEHPDKLDNIVISIMAGSTYVATAQALKQKIPGAKLEMRELQKNDTVDQLLDNINRRKNVVTILDSNIVQGVKGYRDDFKEGAFLSEEEDIVWAMRKDSPELRLRINNFLTKKMVKAPTERKSDWASIKKSKVIRFLTYNGPTSYFMWKGTLMGFDYDLAIAFAEKHNLELELIVVPYDQELIEWLKAGRGDFAGASITITEERKARGVDFSTPYIEMAEQVLSNSAKPPIKTVQDLNGRTLTLRAFSIFESIAKALQDSGIQVKIELAEPEVSYEQIVNMVAEGELDATIVDADAAEVGAALREGLTAGPVVSDPLPQGWMVLKENKSLRERIDTFIKEFKASKQYAKKVNYYFKPDKAVSDKILTRIRPGEDLSPYDKLAKKSAQEHEFDWRLIVAQMWQESSFDPKAESPVGAQGLLQVMPRTAEEVGYPPPLFEPKRGIEAGVKYLSWIRERFDDDINLENRLWFSLAAYNAGIGHLYDAQRLAKDLNLDPNVWFGNVETAMLKLSEPRYFKKARYGYVRGAEPVQYVHNISKLYRAYTDISPGEVALRLRYVPNFTHIPRSRAPSMMPCNPLFWISRCESPVHTGFH